MSESNFEKLDKARKLLKLPEEIRLQDIKQKYHEMIKEFHPDRNRHDNDAHWKTIEIMKAYELIVNYCQNYKISFKKTEVEKQTFRFALGTAETDAEYQQWWQEHYGNDPVWGGKL